MKINTIVCIFLAFLITSCVSNKKIIYIQKKLESDEVRDTLYDSKYTRFIYNIQINDIIYVNIRSYDEKATQLFNPPNNNMMQYFIGNGAGFYLIGYNVTDSGFVDLPIIGKVYVLGKTLDEAKKSIKEEVNKYVVDAFVTVKLNGIGYSVLGEVRRPGKFIDYENQVTILEAIASGGDMTVVANRSNVTLLRQYPDGTKIHYLNLLDKNIINSPYYFIQPNDVIYVEPMKVREYGTGITAFQTFQSVVSVLSLVFLILNLTK